MNEPMSNYVPEPNGSLIKCMPAKAIKPANAEVLKLKDKSPHDSRIGPYPYS